MTTQIIIKLYAYFTPEAEPDKTKILNQLKRKYEHSVGETQKGFDITLFIEVPDTQIDKTINDIVALFDKQKVLEGYLDVYTHLTSRQLHEG